MIKSFYARKVKENKHKATKSTTPKMYVCTFPSPLVAQCESMLGNRSDQTQQQKKPIQGNRNLFCYGKQTKAEESLLKQTSWIVAAGLERLDLPNDSLQVLAE